MRCETSNPSVAAMVRLCLEESGKPLESIHESSEYVFRGPRLFNAQGHEVLAWRDGFWEGSGVRTQTLAFEGELKASLVGQGVFHSAPENNARLHLVGRGLWLPSKELFAFLDGQRGVWLDSDSDPWPQLVVRHTPAAE